MLHPLWLTLLKLNKMKWLQQYGDIFLSWKTVQVIAPFTPNYVTLGNGSSAAISSQQLRSALMVVKAHSESVKSKFQQIIHIATGIWDTVEWPLVCQTKQNVSFVLSWIYVLVSVKHSNFHNSCQFSTIVNVKMYIVGRLVCSVIQYKLLFYSTFICLHSHFV